MVNILALKYPKRSHRKPVTIPKQSAQLAEFFGIMLGDGGINNAWQANITLNAIADKDYAKHVVQLCGDLFKVLPAIRKRKTRETLVISLASTTIVDFLVEKGLLRGNKLAGGLAIPQWIMRERRYRIACLRGLVDTDGCLYVHRHSMGGRMYGNIGLCFTSYAPEMMGQVVSIFSECGIVPHVSGGGRKIYLYSQEAVKKYLDVIGTSNARLERVFQEWRGSRLTNRKIPSQNGGVG